MKKLFFCVLFVFTMQTNGMCDEYKQKFEQLTREHEKTIKSFNHNNAQYGLQKYLADKALKEQTKMLNKQLQWCIAQQFNVQ